MTNVLFGAAEGRHAASMRGAHLPEPEAEPTNEPKARKTNQPECPRIYFTAWLTLLYSLTDSASMLIKFKDVGGIRAQVYMPTVFGSLLYLELVG